MTGVREGQLWVSPDQKTYYVLRVTSPTSAALCLVTIEGEGKLATLRRQGNSVLGVTIAEMLERWMPTTMNPNTPPPTWHQRIMADDD